MGSPDWNVSMVDIHLRKLLWVDVLPWTCRSEGERPSGYKCLLLGRSEVLRSLRHYLLAQSQGRYTIDHLEERETLKEEALDDLP